MDRTNLDGFYFKMLRTHKDLDINYVESIVKRAVEENKNIAWRMAYVSIMASFVISSNVNLIMKIIDLKVINNDVMNGHKLGSYNGNMVHYSPSNR